MQPARSNEESLPHVPVRDPAGMFPRIAFAVYWIARPASVDAAFDTFIVPLLGLIFLPFTTLMYVILWSPGVGVTGSGWLWLGSPCCSISATTRTAPTGTGTGFPGCAPASRRPMNLTHTGHPGSRRAWDEMEET